MSTTYWDKLKEFQPYSFMLNSSGGVVRVADSTGAWLERHKVQELVDSADASLADAQAEIARLRGALEVLETDAHFIFNNPPGGTSQDVRDVIEWFAGSIRVALGQAK